MVLACDICIYSFEPPLIAEDVPGLNPVLKPLWTFCSACS